MARFLSTVQRNLKVDEATSSKDDVTPVYLLEELFETAQSGQDVPGLVDYIIKRLQHRSPVVKLKTLRLIKYIAGKRAPEFKRLMGRHAGAIRELTHFRGDPDPFKGDVPNQRVREQAKDTLEVLFSAQEPPTYTAQASSNTKGRIQGFGSTPSESAAANVSYGASGGGVSYAGGASSYGGAPAYTGGAPSASSSSSKYVGFGNPMMEGVKQAQQPSAAAVATATLDMAKQWVATAGQAVGLAAVKVGVAGPSGRSMLGNEGSNSYGGYGGYTAPSSGAAPVPLGSQPTYGQPRPAAAPGADEEGVVDGICRPGGLRPQPEKQDLVDFVEAVSILDGPRVAALLEDKMVQGPWQSSLRALCALEAVVQQGASTSCGEIAVHFQGTPQAIQDAAKSTQASLRIRANAVLQLLGVGGSSSTSAEAPMTATARPTAAEASLLDFGEELAAASTTQDVIDLLGGGEAAATAPSVGVTPSQPSNGLFDGLDTPTADSTAGMFGGLSLAEGGGDLLGEVPPPVAKQEPQSLASLTDLLPPSPAGGVAPQSFMQQQPPGQMMQQPGLMMMQQPGQMMQQPGLMMQQQPQQMMQQPGLMMQQQPQQMMQQPGLMMQQQPQQMMMMQQQQQQMMMGGFVPGTLPVVQQPPPGATMVMAPNGIPMMAAHPMMMAPNGMPMMAAPNAAMIMGGGAPGGGPIPLEAFHTSRPTPTITPKQDDKFDFVGSMISSSSTRKGMSNGH